MRLVLSGRVSCTEARPLVRTYLRKLGARQCGPSSNNFCNLTFPGGWSCGIFSAAEQQHIGGAVVGCGRKGARIFVYRVRGARALTASKSTAYVEAGQTAVTCTVTRAAARCSSTAGLGFTIEPTDRSARSCGTVTESGVAYRTTILKGSPPCSQVRDTIKHYGNALSSYNWCGGARTCGVGVYAHQWRCTATSRGQFSCWRGGDRKGFHARELFTVETI